jgi:glycolate dehydrogenase iron-sulfur subunit
MQTNFTLAQLADPQIAEADKILRSCVHCGFCTATCPTYVLLGDERDSPRGRIYLIKEMLERGTTPEVTTQVTTHVDRCLSCLSCMTTCPSGVHYMHLVDHARVVIEETQQRPWRDRLLRDLLAFVLPHNSRLRLAMRLGVLGKPFAGLLAALRLRRLAALVELAPWRVGGRCAAERPQLFPAHGPRKGRVALMAGCVTPVVGPSILDAAVRVLCRHGVEVVVPQGQGCCGGLVHHMGRSEEAHAAACRNIAAWTAITPPIDAILVTASGCGTTVKDYGFMLRLDPAHAAAAARVSALAMDVCEYLARAGLLPERPPNGKVVAYHSACALQHGQRITREPKALLSRLGFDVREVPEGHLCCGSAGTYNILQPDIAKMLRARKVGHIEKIEPDVIAAGNVGCIRQIATGTAIPIVHTIELIDWATGGRVPPALQGTLAALPA